MIRPFGEAAFLVDVADSAVAQALDASLRSEPLPWVMGSVPGLRSVLVEIDPFATAASTVTRSIGERLDRVRGVDAPGHARTIPVSYGGEHGPDLEDVARLCGITPADVVARHAATELRVLFAGFAPGFVYLGDLPPELHVPRLDTPRVSTPPGSVAVAGAMSGVYPADLPGGWRVIGRTSIVLFDPLRDPPAYLAPGDRVRFRPVSVSELDMHAGRPADWR